MNDKTAVFVRSFRVGEHTVTMTLTRRRFRGSRITCQWSPTKPTRLTKEEKRQYRSGRAAAVAEAFTFMGSRVGLIIEM
jgi:hypothetical protein